MDDMIFSPICMSSPNKQRRICGEISASFAIDNQKAMNYIDAYAYWCKEG